MLPRVPPTYGPDDAEQRSCDPTHRLLARHEETRNQADDQTKND